jgi:hypothetical protein
MIDSRIASRFYVPLVFLLITAAPAFSQPPGGGADQAQAGQNNQMMQGSPGAGQVQQGQGGQQGQGFGQGPGQGQQPEQMQKMISERLKQSLGATDDEWTIIGPKVLKVFTLTSSQARGLQVRSLMGRSNNQGNAASATAAGNRSSAVAGDKTLEELQKLLENKDATSAQIKNKVSEVRKAKEKNSQELAMAQKELRELLTLRQEAILISVGLLE